MLVVDQDINPFLLWGTSPTYMELSKDQGSVEQLPISTIRNVIP